MGGFLPLVKKAVPEWRAALYALLSLPEIGAGQSAGIAPVSLSASGGRA
jgi:hypothetical protein